MTIIQALLGFVQHHETWHDTCRNEILSLIFEEACTDDGLIGRSLSLANFETRAIRHLYLTDRLRLRPEGADRDLPQDFSVHDANSPLEYSSYPIFRILKTVAPTQPLSDAISLPRLRDTTVHGSSLTHTIWHGSSLTYTLSELPQCLSLLVIFALG
ncbi:hypothetical protein V8D89_009386 [Ganoderma adspersum]